MRLSRKLECYRQEIIELKGNITEMEDLIDKNEYKHRENAQLLYKRIKELEE